MAIFIPLAALVLLVTLALGMVRVLLGPTAADRMVAAQLVASTGVGILVLLAPVFHQSALLDVALVLALLSAVTVAAFVADYRECRRD
jgi:multicomponent Na+:H+ antiporter subunit F